MRFKRHTKLEHGLEQIDIAPLIDCVFTIFIFFMLSSSFTFPTGINVKLPKAITSDVINDQNFIITITSENIVYWNSKIVTVAELEGELKKLPSDKNPVLIKSDRRAYVGRIVDIWDLCRKLGIEKINIATTGKQ